MNSHRISCVAIRTASKLDRLSGARNCAQVLKPTLELVGELEVKMLVRAHTPAAAK